MNAKLLRGHYSHCNPKAAVARDELTRTMNELGHVQEEVNYLGVPHLLKLTREGPSPIGLLQEILPLNNLGPPHDWLPIVSIHD